MFFHSSLKSFFGCTVHFLYPNHSRSLSFGLVFWASRGISHCATGNGRNFPRGRGLREELGSQCLPSLLPHTGDTLKTHVKPQASGQTDCPLCPTIYHYFDPKPKKCKGRIVTQQTGHKLQQGACPRQQCIIQARCCWRGGQRLLLSLAVPAADPPSVNIRALQQGPPPLTIYFLIPLLFSGVPWLTWGSSGTSELEGNICLTFLNVKAKQSTKKENRKRFIKI